MRALDGVRERLALNGVTDARQLDMWTALTTGLVDQQISNDPGGDRWARLIDDFVAMFLAYCQTDRCQRDGTPTQPAPRHCGPASPVMTTNAADP